MRYQITAPQIHCTGCVSLIKLSIEEIYPDVQVDLTTKAATFSSSEDFATVQIKLDTIFNELATAGYQYIDLKQLSSNHN
jgi:copper chaperone CopZ